MNFGQHCLENLFHYQKVSKIQKNNIFKSALNSASKNRIKLHMNFGQHCLENLFHYQKMSKIQSK